MQTAYGPTGIPTRLPPQSHQYPQVNRQFPFLSTLYLPDLSRILNDPILHSPHWPVIPAKLPSDIPKFDGKPGEDPNNHVMTFHLLAHRQTQSSMLQQRTNKSLTTGPFGNTYEADEVSHEVEVGVVARLK
jgi:hypothetical protein